ncbi:MAG TPA: hypothetical protein DEH25_00945, partial [Chloroflexi bacterium]|nr:hypothetical protein [Chloroflexota bacterium]
MKKFMLIFILTLLLIPVSVLAAPGANKLTNPGCESGGDPPTGWTDVTGNIQCFQEPDISAPPYNGTYAFAETFLQDGAIEQIWD